MKNIFLLFLISVLCVSLFPSCRPNERPELIAATGKLQVSFINEVDGQPVKLGPMSYMNASGNQYSVDLLKYYITNFALQKSDGTSRNFGNYNLIDAADTASQTFTLDSVRNGDYTSVSFYVGVDSARNHTGAQEGALDPVNGMIWTWNTGYIFFKHEGSFKNSKGETKPLLFHYGTDVALVKITVPISTVTIAGNLRKIYLKFNLNNLYAQDKIDFNYDNNHMSSKPDDIFWITSMHNNFSRAFQFSKAE